MHLPDKKPARIFVLMGIFGIAMGVLEAIVVVYLRQIYYPEGFEFPLQILSPDMISVEIHREITTIVMLIVIALLAGKNALKRFACFLYTFGVWDIFYYVGLKGYLDWPPSFLTWDILFLIPVVWAGPVLAPVVVSLTMIVLSLCIMYLQAYGFTVLIKSKEWVLMSAGAFIIFCTFIWDYSIIVLREGFLSEFWTLATNERFHQIISAHTPASYNWHVFILGELLIVSALIFIVRRSRTVACEGS